MQKIVILGTGGTIAGRAARADDAVGYRAAELGVQALIDAVPPLAGWPLEAEQVAQRDSKDMDIGTWLLLAQRAAHHLARPDVAGVVVTHGTDTLEETAWFLHRVLAPAKPLVLTAAMRPATALSADGPQNLFDAVTLAAEPDACGVLAVLAGHAHGAADLRKVHTIRLEAFSSGDSGPVALIQSGRVKVLRPWPTGDAVGLPATPADAWPWVAVVANHAGADGREVRALVQSGVAGLVVAGTGNGSLSAGLEAALHAAQSAGVAVRRSSRCAFGPVIDPADGVGSPIPSAGDRTVWQARVNLLLELAIRRS